MKICHVYIIKKSPASDKIQLHTRKWRLFYGFHQTIKYFLRKCYKSESSKTQHKNIFIHSGLFQWMTLCPLCFGYIYLQWATHDLTWFANMARKLFNLLPIDMKKLEDTKK